MSKSLKAGVPSFEGALPPIKSEFVYREKHGTLVTIVMRVASVTNQGYQTAIE